MKGFPHVAWVAGEGHFSGALVAVVPSPGLASEGTGGREAPVRAAGGHCVHGLDSVFEARVPGLLQPPVLSAPQASDSPSRPEARPRVRGRDCGPLIAPHSFRPAFFLSLAGSSWFLGSGAGPASAYSPPSSRASGPPAHRTGFVPLTRQQPLIR